MKPCRLAILGSTNGTNMLYLIKAILQQKLAATIGVVISNKHDAGILIKARAHQLPAIFIDMKSSTREAADKMLSETLMQYDIDLIVLIGYMRVLTEGFIKQWQGSIINVHPSLLPAFAGAMDRQVHQAVLDAGVPESGCTVHLVTEIVDAGPIVTQKKCPVHLCDTIDSLRTRVQQLEGEALIEAIQQIQRERNETNENS